MVGRSWFVAGGSSGVASGGSAEWWLAFGRGRSSSTIGSRGRISGRRRAVFSACCQSCTESGSASISHATASASVNPAASMMPPSAVALRSNVWCFSPSGAVRTLSTGRRRKRQKRRAN